MRMRDMKDYIQSLENRNIKLERQLTELTDKLISLVEHNQELIRENEKGK